jgi:hypothetical protein
MDNRRSLIAGLTAALALAVPRLTAAQQLPKPLGDLTLLQLIGRVTQGLIGVSGALALVMFIYGGFQWMTAQGDKNKIQTAQNTLTWSLLGLGAVFLSYAALRFILENL